MLLIQYLCVLYAALVFSINSCVAVAAAHKSYWTWPIATTGHETHRRKRGLRRHSSAPRSTYIHVHKRELPLLCCTTLSAKRQGNSTCLVLLPTFSH